MTADTSALTTAGEDARRRFTAALLGSEAAPPPDVPPASIVRGVVLEATRHMVSLATADGESRLLFSSSTAVWRGGPATADDLRPGDDAIVRCGPGGRWLVERVWAQLARATGTITSADRDGAGGDTVVGVDPGHGRPPLTAVIPYRSSGRMDVRHPVLEPGYLFDAVGMWRNGAVIATTPATTQPPYAVAAAPRRPRTESVPKAIEGIATWFDPVLGRSAHTDPRAWAAGAAYPALDPPGNCGPGCDRGDPCLPLPRLSLGATLTVAVEDGETAVVPVTACASAASRFCDRCRGADGLGSRASGRVAELTLPTFIGLGGDPEAGCVPATVRVG